MEIKETIYEFISANGLFNEHYQTVIYRICSGLKLGQQTVKSALSSLHEDKRIKVQKDGDRIIVADGGVVFKGTVSCRPNSRYAHIVVAGQTEDIYVADKKDALNGDIVKVGYSFRNGKKEAFIVEIVERKNLLAIGTIVKASDGVVSFVPDDKSLSGKIFLNQTTNLNSMIGQKVSLKLTYVNSKVFKNKSSNMICGQIDKVIGLAGDPITENRAIALLYGFSKEFPGNVVSEAQQLPNKLRKEDYFGCEDFRDLNFVTIDPKTCKDMDDATYVEKTKNGYKIFVAIADVAHFVPENSEMYKEAKKRGTSCYLGDGVYPMYHEYLTNGICSLVEGDDRRVVCMIGEIDNNGKLQKYEIKRAVINSKHKLSNEDADEIYFCTNGKEKEFADIKNIIDLSFEASDVLAAMRKKRGAIAICSKEPSFVLDETKTKVLDVENSAELKSTKIIESFMVLANEISARFFIENAIPALYRVDDLPDEEKINTLRIVLNDLDINFGGENNPFEIQKLIDSLHGNPLEDFVSNSIIRCFAKAKYQPENIGHFGLGSKAYAHSTAPIRRFPDTLVQHIVSKWIDKENCIMDFDLLQALGVHSSEQERKAQDAETLSDSLLSAIWAEGQLGKKMEGFVTGVSSSSIFVQLKDKLVTVEIPVIELEGKDRARYCTNPLKTKISCVDGKEFKLGQSVALVMYNADRAEKKIFASLNLDRKIEKPLGAVAKTEVCEPKRQIDKKKKQNRNSEYSL